jgi:hypothetical protein
MLAVATMGSGVVIVDIVDESENDGLRIYVGIRWLIGWLQVVGLILPIGLFRNRVNF